MSNNTIFQLHGIDTKLRLNFYLQLICKTEHLMIIRHWTSGSVEGVTIDQLHRFGTSELVLN